MVSVNHLTEFQSYGNHQMTETSNGLIKHLKVT